MNNNIDWIIHLVANGACDECGKEEKGFLPYTCNAHTHGMEKYGHPDFQVILSLPPREIGRILNTLGLTVREWVESFGIPIHDNDFIAWQKALFSVRQQIVELEKMLPDKSMERVWSITYQALYLNYDIQEDFRKQFQKNSDRLIDALEHLPALWKELSHE